MPANRAVLLARPDQQTGLTFGAGNLDESDARFLGHVVEKKRSH
jgi:hypothetical protein